jgi:hypothetical protein
MGSHATKPESKEHDSACTIHMGAAAKIHSESVQGTDWSEWLGKILRLRKKGSVKWDISTVGSF